MAKEYSQGEVVLITKFEPTLNNAECAGVVLKAFDADVLLPLWAEHNAVEKAGELHTSALGVDFWSWLISNGYIRQSPINVLHTGGSCGIELTDAGAYGS